MKFIVLADLHLPDRTDTVKEQVLNWIVDVVKQEQPDYLIGAGDLTAYGTIPASERLVQKLKSTGVPFLLTPGNAELRSPEVANQVAQILKSIDEKETPFRMIDTSGGWLMYPEQLQDLPDGAILVTHSPLGCLSQKDRETFSPALEKCNLLITGHLHKDEVNGKCHIVRGLDPDKAIGGVPALVVFEQKANEWIRRDVSYTAADPGSWTPEERQDFLDHLGLSAMYETMDVITFATEQKVKCLEIRFQLFDPAALEELNRAIQKWRATGGKHLSYHMPDIGWREGSVSGVTNAVKAAEQVIAIGCDRVTLHVPHFSVGMAKDANIYHSVLKETAKVVDFLVSSGVCVGIENMHMTPGEKTDDNRRYGYTTAECLRWINDLRAMVSKPERVGYHFDIGHARNNAPYSSQEPVSSWLAAMGPDFNGMHLHQIRHNPDGSMENHTPLLQLYQPLISLASLFLAWHNGTIRHSPMFLEIRGGTGPESLLALRRLIDKN